MSKRNIIVINEDKCNGCGLCIPDCPEGALRLIDGKAKLIGELLCDGLGACIGTCPEGALSIQEIKAEKYNETKVMENVVKQGPSVIAAHLKHLKEHRQIDYFNEAIAFLKKNNLPISSLEERKQHLNRCPGMMMRDLRSEKKAPSPASAQGSFASELSQWPIQLQLLNPHAPYFQDADLVIAADCVPFTFANFHSRFLKGKTLIIFCPKLDTEALDLYHAKLTSIFKDNSIKSVTIVHMEVPCCFSAVGLVEKALKQSRKTILLKEYTISVTGEII